MSAADSGSAPDPADTASLVRDLAFALDSLDVGVLVLDAEAHVTDVQSAAVTRLFGALDRGTPFATVLATRDGRAGASFRDNWDQLVAGFFPIDLTIEQLPRTMVTAERRYELRYTPKRV